MKDMLNFAIAGSEVKRYHAVRTLTEETVGHHSHGVAVIAKMLMGDQMNPFVLIAALYHDLAEHQTGDIPSNSKQEYGIGDQVSALEDRLLASVGLAMPELSKEEKRVLKLADIAQGALFCVKERQLGNKGMKTVYERYRSYAEAFVLVGKERKLFDLINEMWEDAK